MQYILLRKLSTADASLFNSRGNNRVSESGIRRDHTWSSWQQSWRPYECECAQGSCYHKEIMHESCLVEVQYISTILYHAHGKYHMVCTTICKVLCPLYQEIDTTKIYGEINLKIQGVLIQTIISLSRNVNLDKISACH